jgi:hypothetical protein
MGSVGGSGNLHRGLALSALALSMVALCYVAVGPVSCDEVVAGVNSQATAIQSGRFLLQTEIVPVGQHPVGEHEIIDEELVLDGVRSRLDRTFRRPDEPADSPAAVESYVLLFDGEKAVQQSILPVEMVEVSVPQCLEEELGHVLSLPRGLLGRMLEQQIFHWPALGDRFAAEGAHQAGEEDVRGLRCLRLVSAPEAMGSGTTTKTWWVSPDNGYAVAQYALQQVVGDPDGAGFIRTVVDTAEEWMGVGGIRLPEVTVQQWYIQLAGSSEPELRRTATTRILAAAVNTAISDEAFEHEPAAVSQPAP